MFCYIHIGGQYDCRMYMSGLSQLTSAPQVGVQLPDAEVAGRVAYSVAQNLTRKAQEQLEAAQESGKHALSSAVGLEDAPEHKDSPEGSDAERDKHGKIHPGASDTFYLERITAMTNF